MALLTSDEKLFKDLGVYDYPDEAKKNYVAEQLSSIQSIVWRLRVDLILNDNVETTSEEQKEQLTAKSKELVREIKQTAKALRVLEKLNAELNS